jgi:hypothetical protein
LWKLRYFNSSNHIDCIMVWTWSSCSWIYNYICHQCLSPLMLWVRISIRPRCATIFKVCQWLATGRWFSPGTPVSSTKRTDRHDITEILLKVALNTITNKLCNDMSARLECGRFECRSGHTKEYGIGIYCLMELVFIASWNWYLLLHGIGIYCFMELVFIAS